MAGAAIGGVAGIVVAAREEKDAPTPIHPGATKYVVLGACLGLPFAVVLGWALVGLAYVLFPKWGNILVDASEMLPLAPSLFLLPIGAGAMIGALLARVRFKWAGEPEDAPKQSYGMRLAWRIAWLSFVLSSLLTGLGYAVMLMLAFLW